MAAKNDPALTDLASLFTPAEVLCGLDQLDEDEILRRLIERIAQRRSHAFPSAPRCGCPTGAA